MVDPFLLDPLQTLLVALEGGFDRCQQLLEFGFGRLVGGGEALARLVEKILMGFFKQLVADRPELRHQRVLRLLEVVHPLVEIARVGLERGLVAQRRVAFADHRVEHRLKLLRPRPTFGRGPRAARTDQPADQRPDGQRGDCEHDDSRVQRTLLRRNEMRT